MSGERPEEPGIDAAGVQRLREALQREEVGPGEAVDVDLVWRAVRLELPAEERRAVVARVAQSPAWAQAWRLAHALSQAAAGAEAPAPVVSLAARRRTGLLAPGRPLWGALAAALLLMVGAFILRQQLQQREDPTRVRGGMAEPLRSAVPEAAALPREACVLRWEGVPGATRFSVQVSSEDLTLFHHAERLAQREYQVPAAVLAPLPRGARLLWQVEAHLPDGSVQRSSTFVNQLE